METVYKINLPAIINCQKGTCKVLNETNRNETQPIETKPNERKPKSKLNETKLQNQIKWKI
jgi:hypothetical protein